MRALYLKLPQWFMISNLARVWIQKRSALFKHNSPVLSVTKHMLTEVLIEYTTLILVISHIIWVYHIHCTVSTTGEGIFSRKSTLHSCWILRTCSIVLNYFLSISIYCILVNDSSLRSIMHHHRLKYKCVSFFFFLLVLWIQYNFGGTAIKRSDINGIWQWWHNLFVTTVCQTQTISPKLCCASLIW